MSAFTPSVRDQAYTLDPLDGMQGFREPACKGSESRGLRIPRCLDRGRRGPFRVRIAEPEAIL